MRWEWKLLLHHGNSSPKTVSWFLAPFSSLPSVQYLFQTQIIWRGVGSHLGRSGSAWTGRDGNPCSVEILTKNTIPPHPYRRQTVGVLIEAACFVTAENQLNTTWALTVILCLYSVPYAPVIPCLEPEICSVQVPALPFLGCVTLKESLNLSEQQTFICKMSVTMIPSNAFSEYYY